MASEAQNFSIEDFAEWSIVETTARPTTDAEIKIEVWQSSDGIILISLEGVYPDGGAGNPLAKSLLTYGENLCDRLKPSAIILDMRQLVYRWGDMIDWLYHISDSYSQSVRQATIVSDLNRKALTTLEFDDLSSDITDLEFVFETFAAALTYVRAIGLQS